MCAGNTIKTTIGNTENCDADAPCDGVKTVPNENHTDCGEIRYYYFSKIFKWQVILKKKISAINTFLSCKLWFN